MPNNQNRSNQDFSRLDRMTNEELEEILRLDAQKNEGEESDLEMLLYVMEVLAVRRKNSGTLGKTAGEAFKSFEENYWPTEPCDKDPALEVQKPKHSPKSKKRFLPWLRRVSSVAAILAVVLLSAITAQAMGLDIWRIIVNWTEETFHFSVIQQDETFEPTNIDETGYISLQEALRHKLISTPLSPTWIPDKYELLNIEVDETPLQLTFLAIYQCGNEKMKIQIKRYIDSDPEQIEQSDALLEIYECNGIIYYIFSDNEQLRAAWVNESYECYITGQLSLEDIKTMVDSIQ